MSEVKQSEKYKNAYRSGVRSSLISASVALMMLYWALTPTPNVTEKMQVNTWLLFAVVAAGFFCTVLLAIGNWILAEVAKMHESDSEPVNKSN